MSETADYWKERYEAVCQMAREDREILKVQIESLQRTNEELERDAVPRSRYKAVCKEVDEWKQKYGDLTAKATAEIDRLEAAAITPEMRKRAETLYRRYQDAESVISVDVKTFLRDLLKETVGPLGGQE